MRQIGQMAGVSESTVSRILSGRDFRIPIAADTRQRGYSVVLGHAQSRAEEAAALQTALATHHCDATILLDDLRDESKFWAGLLNSKVPLIGLCRGARTRQISMVNVDNAEGTRLVLDYLYQLGHRRIAFVHGGWIGDGRERERAYQAFVRERNLPLRPGYTRAAENDLGAGFAAARALLALPQPPTAIVAASDVIALGVLKAAASRGVRVPEQLSVAGVVVFIPTLAFIFVAERYLVRGLTMGGVKE